MTRSTKCPVCSCLWKNCECPDSDNTRRPLEAPSNLQQDLETTANTQENPNNSQENLNNVQEDNDNSQLEYEDSLEVCAKCRERGTLGEGETCTCCSECGQSTLPGHCLCCRLCHRNTAGCSCCKTCRRPADQCPGCCSECKKNPCECTCPECGNQDCSCVKLCSVCNLPEDSECECCSVCGGRNCQTCCRTCQKEVCQCQCLVCLAFGPACFCCRTCRKAFCICCRNCRRPDCGICCLRCFKSNQVCQCCNRCQSLKDDCSCNTSQISQVSPAPAPPANQKKKTSGMSSLQLEPPDMGILKDPTQLSFYITSLERWATLSAKTGLEEENQGELVLAIAFKQHAELCKEMSEHFAETLRDNKEGIKMIVEWLKEKFGLNKHADMIKILNTFLNTCRVKNESLIDFTARFEKNYAEVKKMGENLSPTCLAILLLRQAQLTDTDSQIITINLEFDPKAKDSDKNFERTKAAMKKFQHTRLANHQAVAGHQHHGGAGGGKPTAAYITALEESEEFNKEDLDNIKTYVASLRRDGGRVGGQRGRGGGAGQKRFWKCDYCICTIHPKYKPCPCPCSNHTRENCPKPDPALKEAFRKRKAEQEAAKANKKHNGGDDSTSNQQQRGERQYITYSRNFTQTLADSETDYEMTLLAKDVKEKESDVFQPLDALYKALETPTGARGPLYRPAVHHHAAPQGVQAQHRAAGHHVQVDISADNYSRANSQFCGTTGVSRPFTIRPPAQKEDNDVPKRKEPGYSQGRRRPEGANVLHPIPLRGKGAMGYAQAGDPLAIAATSSTEEIFLRDSSGQPWQQTAPLSKELHKLYILLDCGSPSTIVGVNNFRIIKEQYPEMIQSSFEYKESNKHYEFGGGVKTFSMGRVRLPIYVLDKDQQAHLLHIWVEVLNQQHLPLLFGGRSFKRSQGTLCFKTFTLTVDWKGKRLCLPIKEADTGHYHLQFFPMSRQEDNLLTREIINQADWDKNEVRKILTYLASEDQPQVSKIKTPELLNKTQKTPLSRKQVIHLHQALGHVHRDNLRKMIKEAGMFDDNTLRHVDNLEKCEVCAVEHNRLPRPRVAAPRANNFNHVLALDLKQNTRYKNAPPFILYFVDTFTRFKAAVFIKNKQGDTIAEHIVTEWVKLHGAPKYLMSDNGHEFLNGAVKDLCQFHGIRFTTTASYSPHQNAYVERGHAVADRALERMLTADPSLKPEVALCWVVQAVNTLQNVNGFTPFQLVFGRLPRHPTLVEDNPGATEEIADSSATWARHYRMMMAAREAFIASESDRTIRKALQQRVYTSPDRVQVGDWVYFKRNHERYWKGPAKVVMKNGKTLHTVFHGQPTLVNSDDVLLNKPETEEVTMEQFVMLPHRHQPPTSGERDTTEAHPVPGEEEVPEIVELPDPCPVAHQHAAQQGVQARPGAAGPSTQVSPSKAASIDSNSLPSHDVTAPSLNTDANTVQNNIDVSKVVQSNNDDQDNEVQAGQSQQEREVSAISSGQDEGVSQSAGENQVVSVQGQGPVVSQSQSEVSAPCQTGQQGGQQAPDELSSPANSTIHSATDLGVPLQCNLCEEEFSTKNFQSHCRESHNLQSVNVRQHATIVSTKPDSIYENVNALKPGTVLADQKGNYLTLIKPTSLGWTVENVNTKQREDLELVKDMVSMRFIGVLERADPEGIFVSHNGRKVYLDYGDYTKKVFFTAQVNYHEEQVFVINIPRAQHGDPECVAAKKKELQDFENYDVFEVVDKPDRVNMIATEWVLVRKDKPDGSTVVKARLCLRGDQEEALHKIPRESPTVNKISVKVLLTLAVSQGWDIRSCDVERAFLQSEPIGRDVFVKPPVELQLPRGKVLRLKKTAYGLVDASRAFFLKQAKEFKSAGFQPLQMDPALFIHKAAGAQMCNAGAAVHVDDALNVGEKCVLDKAQKELQTKLTYGSVEKLPFRFLGGNYRQEADGEVIMDQQHYVDALEVPEMRELASMVKQDVLPPHLQSTFRSLASKINVLAATVRPDFTYAAKYLTTRYSKATKSDMTQVSKLIIRAKAESTEIVIPNIGEPEEWILVGIVDASHRTGGNLFAVGGHVVMLQNKTTQAASVLHWASKKITRVVHSSAAAETISMQKMFSTLYFIRRILSEMCGDRVKSLECVALTDNQVLFTNIMHLKTNPEDFRLHSDIIELRQSIEQEKTVQEVRYVHSSQNLSDCLTKTTKSGHMLLHVVRTGQYELPGGTHIRDTTMSSVRTWNELMRSEEQENSSPPSWSSTTETSSRPSTPRPSRGRPGSTRTAKKTSK